MHEQRRKFEGVRRPPARAAIALLLLAVSAPALVDFGRWMIGPSAEIIPFASLAATIEGAERVTPKRSPGGELFFVNFGAGRILAKLKWASGSTRRLWLSHGVADNHATVTLRQGAAVLGKLNNQRSEAPGRVVWHFDQIGVLNPEQGPATVEIARDDGKPFYTELGAAVLAPEDATKDQVIAAVQPLAVHVPLMLLAFLVGLYLAVSLLPLPAPLCSANVGRALFGLLLVAPLALAAVSARYNQRAANHSGEFLPGRPDTGAAWTDEVGRWLHAKVSRPFSVAKKYAPQPPGTLETQVFHGNTGFNPTRPSALLLGGGLAMAQTLSPHHAANWVFFVLLVAFAAAVAGRRSSSPRVGAAFIAIALTAASAASVLVSLRLSQGWDELYVNLRHSQVLRDAGIYSYNQRELAEATVDFLPFFATGLIGKLGAKLDDTILVLTLLGNVLCIVAAYLMSHRITRSPIFSIFVAAALGLAPSVVFVGGTGFTATLFTGWLLLGLHFLFFTEKRRWVGIGFLSTLTLIRTEGVVFAALAFALSSFLSRIMRPEERAAPLKMGKGLMLEGGALAAPFVISAIVRWWAFGAPLPNPIRFKNSNGDLNYLASGATELLTYLKAFEIPWLLAPAVMLALIPLEPDNPLRRHRKQLLLALLLCAAGIAPYHVGGGDWFPWYWSRYQAPFTAVAVIAFFAAGYALLAQSFPKEGPWIAACAAALILYSALGRPTRGAYGEVVERFNSTELRGGWGRVDTLAAFGQLLKEHTRPDAVIASPELATIMFHAERDLLDLLGTANREIAETHLNPLGPGDKLHRKRNPETLRHHRPEVIALFEPALTRSPPGPATKETILSDVHQRAFPLLMNNIAYYRAGSYADLLALGYRHLTVSTQHHLFQFFVLESEFASLRSSLLRRGFEDLGSGGIPYAYEDAVTSRFAPIAEHSASIH